MHGVSVEHEVAVGRYLAVVSEQEHLGVEVELRAAVERVDVPAETRVYLRQPGVALCKFHFLTLDQIYHINYLSFIYETTVWYLYSRIAACIFFNPSRSDTMIYSVTGLPSRARRSRSACGSLR